METPDEAEARIHADAERGIAPGSLLVSRDQVWVDERALQEWGYASQLGEIVRVRTADGQVAFLELAAKLPAFKAGLPGQGLVWWLLLIDPEKEVPDDAAAAAQPDEKEGEA